MQRVVINSDIIFSLLIVNNKRLRDRLFEDDLTFYAPNFLVIELFRIKEQLIEYSMLTNEEYSDLVSIVFEKIIFIGNEYISKANKAKAYHICNPIDNAATPFVALCLHLSAGLWSTDDNFKAALKSNGFDQFYR